MGLEQAEIDAILREEEAKREREERQLELNYGAVNKLRTMFREAMDMELDNPLKTWDDIESYIGIMQYEVKPGFRYYDSFNKLLRSFERKEAQRARR